MKINNQTFNLNEELIVSIDQEDNDGLINCLLYTSDAADE